VSDMSGVGMPASLLLEQFGDYLTAVFGYHVYHVGSSMCHAQDRNWRDVDVRVLLDDDEYTEMFGAECGGRTEHENMKWVAYTLAFSALGKQMTGLPIDFQIQRTSEANEQHDKPRSALGIRRAISRTQGGSK
jgi:hypothetical protein